MKKPSKPGSTPPAPDPAESREQLLQSFRAFLHLAITASQLGRREQLASAPGPDMPALCRALAELPENTLARELASPVLAVLAQMSDTANFCEAVLRREPGNDLQLQAAAQRTLAQLDLGLAFILRTLVPLAACRAEFTQDRDLLCEATRLAVGDGLDAARLIRRYQALLPDDSRDEDGAIMPDSFPELFAWDAYQRIEALDSLADDFPEQVARAARQMHAWPMLVHRHTRNRRRFRKLADKLGLGAEYPTDAGEGARYRPDTPMVRYLDPLIHRLHVLRCWTKGEQFPSVAEENKRLRTLWWTWPEEFASDQVLAVLRAARQLAPLTKTTALAWAKNALVPLILATDAIDPDKCEEPVLQQIRKQGGVKSRGTFNSRLSAAVAATLRRLARPD